MKPRTLSASALQSFACPARYNAEYILRAPDTSGSSATLGTACHSALEDFISKGWAQDGQPVTILIELFDHYYWQLFEDDDRLSEGYGMLQNWYERSKNMWADRTVLSTEKKQTFDLPTSQGIIPFTFIFDRMDQLPDGTVEVWDYKSNMQALTADDLRNNIQAQVYGLAARLMFPEAPAIWVKLDFLRHDSVGIRFTPEENKRTWDFLIATAEDILASDGTEEVINDKCRWCIRRHDCETLTQHIFAGGPLALNDLAQMALQRHRLHSAKKALEDMVSELDSALVDRMEDEGVTELQLPEVKIALTAGKRRHVKAQQVVGLAGERARPYVGLTLSAMDEMLSKEDFSADEMTAIRGCVEQRFNRVGIKITPVSALEEAD